MHLAFRYRFFPTQQQTYALAQTFGCCRVVWNYMLRLRTDAYFTRRERLGYADLSGKLTRLKQQTEFSYLRNVSSVPLQQTLRNQQAAFKNFFEKRARYPRFKAKRGKQSATYVSTAFRWDGSMLTLAKMKQPLRIRWSRPVEGTPTSVTITKDATDRYFVSLCCKRSTSPLPETDNAVGVDVGLVDFATLSTGEKIANPRYHKRDLAKLRRANKALHRKQKGSRNREKARLRVARIHARIADRRTDFLHKLSTRLIRENQAVMVEDLNVCGMVRNHSLARSISDAGWGEFFRQLEYKAEWYGRRVVKINRWFPSSKRCSSCGYVISKLPLGKRRWRCPECGAEHDRDHNAALNILAVGRTATACGDAVRH